MLSLIIILAAFLLNTTSDMAKRAALLGEIRMRESNSTMCSTLDSVLKEEGRRKERRRTRHRQIRERNTEQKLTTLTEKTADEGFFVVVSITVLSSCVHLAGTLGCSATDQTHFSSQVLYVLGVDLALFALLARIGTGNHLANRDNCRRDGELPAQEKETGENIEAEKSSNKKSPGNPYTRSNETERRRKGQDSTGLDRTSGRYQITTAVSVCISRFGWWLQSVSKGNKPPLLNRHPTARTRTGQQ